MNPQDLFCRKHLRSSHLSRNSNNKTSLPRWSASFRDVESLDIDKENCPEMPQANPPPHESALLVDMFQPQHVREELRMARRASLFEGGGMFIIGKLFNV